MEKLIFVCNWNIYIKTHVTSAVEGTRSTGQTEKSAPHGFEIKCRNQAESFATSSALVPVTVQL
jgi:hypothetical protein